MTPKKQNESRFPDELIDQLLAKYEKPEDLTGKDGILKAADSQAPEPGPGRRA